MQNSTEFFIGKCAIFLKHFPDWCISEWVYLKLVLHGTKKTFRIPYSEVVPYNGLYDSADTTQRGNFQIFQSVRFKICKCDQFRGAAFEYHKILKLISRKISMTEIFYNIHTVDNRHVWPQGRKRLLLRFQSVLRHYFERRAFNVVLPRK